VYWQSLKCGHVVTVRATGRGGARKVAKLCSGIVEMMRHGITIPAMHKIMHMLGDGKGYRNYYHAFESDTDFDTAIYYGWVDCRKEALSQSYSATQKTLDVLGITMED
jgi:hypothetical protein